MSTYTPGQWAAARQRERDVADQMLAALKATIAWMDKNQVSHYGAGSEDDCDCPAHIIEAAIAAAENRTQEG